MWSTLSNGEGPLMIISIIGLMFHVLLVLCWVCGSEWSIFCYHKYQYQQPIHPPSLGPGLQLQRLQKRGCCVIVSSSQLNGIIQFNINIEHCLCSRLRTAILCHYAVNLALYLTTTYNSAINMRTLIWTCLNTATLASQGTYHHCNCI